MLDAKIQTFIKVVELKSYTRAAEALHLTQPAVTQHIKKLENHYKCSLFEKKGKTMTLTRNGQALYKYSLLQEINEKHLLENMDLKRQTLRIGATLSIADYYLPKYLNAYMEKSKAPFSVTVRNTKALLDQLLDGSLHCAFIEGDFNQDLFDAHEFCTTEFIGVIRKDHPLAPGKVSLKSCLAYPLIIREKGSGTRAILEKFLLEKNLRVDNFKQNNEIGSFAMIKAFIEHSDGISFMYEGVCSEAIKKGTLKKILLTDFSITRTLHFIYPVNSILKSKYVSFFNTLINESKEEK